MSAKRQFSFDDRTRQGYLDHLATNGLPYEAAKAIGTRMKIVTAECEKNQEFAEGCIEATHIFRESIEKELHRRAVLGVEEPVFYMGEPCGTIRKFSDSLMTLLVKKVNPDYGDKLKVDTTIKGGVLLAVAPAASPEEWLEAQKRMSLAAQNRDGVDGGSQPVIDITEPDPVPA